MDKMTTLDPDVTERLLVVEQEVRRLRRAVDAARALMDRFVAVVTDPEKDPGDDLPALREELKSQMLNLHSEFGCIQLSPSPRDARPGRIRGRRVDGWAAGNLVKIFTTLRARPNRSSR